MSDSFRYGNKKEINFEQFAQKLNKVQSSSNADLWKIFGVFDRDKNGKIEAKNSTGELEAKSLFNYIQSFAGENNVLNDDEIENMLKDSQIPSDIGNPESVVAALKDFFNSFVKDDDIITEVKDGVTVKKQNNQIIELIKDGKTFKYVYNKDSVDIETPTEKISVSKVEDDGSFLAENFIKKVYKNEKGEEVTVVKDKNGRITETVEKSENETVTTMYNTLSVHVYDNYKSEHFLQAAQIMVKNGEEYFVLYDENGNTVTHAANNDSIPKLLEHLGFESIEQLYELNPKLKNPKHVLKVGEAVTVPGHRDVTNEEIQNQGSIAGETNQYVKAYNEKLRKEYAQDIEKFRKDNFDKFDKEAFEALNKTKGFELTNENSQMYFKISQLPQAAQKTLVGDIQARVEKGQTPDSIKEYYLNEPFISLDGKNLTTINLFDGPTIEIPSFSASSPMHIGNFITNCDTELLFSESGTKTKNFSVKTFFTKVLGLDITSGQGKTLYEQFCKVNDPMVMMDINAMFSNIARRTSPAYKKQYDKAKSELTDSYKKTYLGQGIAEALNSNPPLSQNEAKKMFIAVIQSMTAPKGHHVRTNYDSFINDHKDFYLRKFSAEMVAFLYNRNSDIAQQTSNSKSILNPVGKGVLGFLAPRYSKDAKTIYALMTSDCYLGNKKIESTIKGYDTQYKGYDVAKVRSCWNIMQNPNSTEEQKLKALSDAFGSRLVHAAEDLTSVCNFADGVTDIILLMYGTGIIGKGITKAISLIPRAGSTVAPIEAMITGSRGLTWGQRLTSVGVSSATFSLYDSARFAIDYYSSDMYTSKGISFDDGITSAAAHSAVFGGFAAVWGQAVTGNVLKWLFKSPQTEEVAAETMRLVTNQFKNASKMSGKQVVSAFQGAQAKAATTAGKEVTGFGSELIGFSTYEILQKAYSGELKDSSLTDILSGQFKTLLSFKAVGKILFMHKAGKLPPDAIKLDESKDVSIEPVKKDGRTEFKISYPDGKIVNVPDMQGVVALCNKHYEDVAIYEPLAKTLETENSIELDDGITISKGENGYTVEFKNGEKVEAKDLRGVMGKAQAKYQLIQYNETLKKDGVCELPNGQKITLDRKTGEFLTTLESGTKISADTLEELLQKASETQLCENIESSLSEHDGKIFLDENTLLVKKEDNTYELKLVLNNGEVLNFKGESISEVVSKANSAKFIAGMFELEAKENGVSQEETLAENEDAETISSLTETEQKEYIRKKGTSSVNKKDLFLIFSEVEKEMPEFIKIRDLSGEEKFMQFLKVHNPKEYENLQRKPYLLKTQKYKEQIADLEKFYKLKYTIEDCRNLRGTEEAEELYENYLQNEYVSESSETAEHLKDLCRQINKDFGVKVFLPSNLKEAGVALKLIYQELACYKMHAQENGAKAELPPTLEFFVINEYFAKDDTIVGGCSSTSDKSIQIKGLNVDIKSTLRHELAHANEQKHLSEFPEGFNPKQYEQIFREANLSDESIEYGQTSPAEFLATAAQGDMSKYPPQLREALKSLGMPEWMFNMPANFTQADIDRVIKSNLENKERESDPGLRILKIVFGDSMEFAISNKPKSEIQEEIADVQQNEVLQSLGKTNVALISKMETALKSNKPEEVMQLFEQMSDKAKRNVKDLVEKFESNGLTLDSYLSACVKQPPLFYQSPETIEKNIKGLVEKFDANGLTLDSYLSACVKQPPLFCQSVETIEKNVIGLVEKFKSNGLSLDSYLSACIKQPSLFGRLPESIEKNVKKLVEKFKENGLTVNDYLQACIKKPSLLSLSPETIEKNINDLVEKFEKNGLVKDDYLKACLKHPQLFYQSSETIEKNIKDLVEKFESYGLTLDSYLSACVKQPSLFGRLPESIEKNVKKLVEKFKENGLTVNDYLQACIKKPSLLSLSPETIEKNINDLVEKFEKNGLVKDDYLKACLKHPQLFYQSSETIEKNIKDLVEKFESYGLTLDSYLSACVKQPQLFSQSPETIEKNIKGLVEKFEANGLNLDSYLSVCVKQPKLFSQSPETIEKNVKDLVKKFEANGLTLDAYLSVCLKRPTLFHQSPETIEKNVKDLVKKFEANGLTLDSYLSACVKQPQLFYLSPETIENNVKSIVEKFESNGLTLDSYLSACVKQPQLFYQSPETIEKNIKGLVEKFDANGLTLDSYLSACVKQPQLFCQSVETIEEHINIIRFSQFNNGKEIDNEDFWSRVLKNPLKLCCSSSLLLTEGLIIPKIFENGEIPKELKGKRLKQKLEDYLKSHPNEKYVLNIQNIPGETSQVEILRDYLAKLTEDLKLPKDMFKINVEQTRVKKSTDKRSTEVSRKSENQNASKRKPTLGVSENADMEGVVLSNAKSSRSIDPSRFECTEDGLKQILDAFNQKHAEQTNMPEIEYYNEDERSQIMDLFKENPEFVMNLLKEQLSIEQSGSSYNLSSQQIETLMRLKKDFPDIYDKMPIRDEQTGELRENIDRYQDAVYFMWAYQDNPELTMDLVNRRYKSGNETYLQFSSYVQVAYVIHNMDSNSVLKDAVNAKVISTDGKERYAYSYKQIQYGLMDIYAPPREKALMQLKTKDGKYQLFSQEDIEMLLRRDIDGLLKDLENPEEASRAIKQLQILLADSKYYKATNKSIEAMFDSVSNEFIMESIPDEAYAVEVGELYVDGTYEVRALTKDGIQTTRFRYNPDKFYSVDVISNEEVISQDEHSTTVRTEFADGRVSIDVFEKGDFESKGTTSSYTKSQKHTEYDKDGELIYEETITPSKVLEGELDIVAADRINGRVSVSETKMFGKTKPLIQTQKRVVSQNGVTTEIITLQEEGCRKHFYVIKDADNNVILSQERQHFQFDDNTFMSLVNGQKYDIKFEDDKIIVEKEGEIGQVAETITLDFKTIDPRLKNLFKQVPGDLLFALHKAGVTSVNISTAKYNKNGAFYSPGSEASITISEELMNNPFVFAHELGHAMDELLLGDLSKDPQLKEIFDKELEAYRAQVSDAEGRIIDYFSTQIHYAGNCLMEVVAEVNALLSGARNDWSEVSMRGLKLMQNFPETIKYIADKVNPALDGKTEVSKSKSENAGRRLGISADVITEETITVFDELEVEVGNMKTKSDAEIVRQRLYEHKSELSEEQFKQFETKIDDFMAQYNHSSNPDIITQKGLVLRHDEQKSAQLEAERRTRVAALDLMDVQNFSELGKVLDNMVGTIEITNASDIARFNELVTTGDLSEQERTYFQTLIDNRLNPPTIDNYKPEQIAAEVQHMIRHFKNRAPYIIEDTRAAGLKTFGHVSQRIKSDTSLYDKLYNFLSDKNNKEKNLMDALEDVRDAFGTRSLIDAGDYSDKPNVKIWLDAAKEEGLTPKERRERLIKAAREAAIYQSEDLVWMLQQQMIQQKKSDDGLEAVRMVNYASSDGVPVLSETQLWELYCFAQDLGIKNDHIKIIDVKEVMYPNGKIYIQEKDIFTKEVIEKEKYSTHAQPSGYTALQMNFETNKGEKIEFQARDVITDELGEAEHLIYDTITGKDIVGRHPKLRPLYDQLLQVLDEANLDKRVCKKYRTEYLKDYYTYCRAKSNNIDIGEPKLQEYAERWGRELGIPDLKLDPRLDAKNLMALHDIASSIKHGYLSEYDGVELYQLHVQFSRGEAPQDAFNAQAERLWTDMQKYCETDITLEDMKNLSQQELVAKLDVFKTFEKEFAGLREVDRYPIIYIIMHNVTPENLHSVKEMYHYLKEFHRQTGEDFEPISALRIASNTKPEARYYAQEFIEATKENQELRENLGFEFLITDSSMQTVKERLELYKFFSQYTHAQGKYLYTMLEQNQNTYPYIMKVYNKVMDDKNLDDKQKENILKQLPFDCSEPKFIAENYDYLLDYINRGGELISLSNLAYTLNLSHPDDKQELVDKLIVTRNPAFVELEGYKKAIQRGYYNSTKQSEFANQNVIEMLKKRCKEVGFTDEDLANCTLETLQAYSRYSSYLSLNKKTLTEENKKVLLSNNLEKRVNILNITTIDFHEKLLLCSDEEFDRLSEKIIARPRTQLGASSLNKEEIDRLINMSDEEYNKLDNIYENIIKKYTFSSDTLSLLLSLSDNGLDNVLKRWEFIEKTNLNPEQKRIFIEMSDAEFENKSKSLSERPVGEDIDKEAYRKEVRAKLDGTYTLDMSAYEKSRAKKAADRADKDRYNKRIPFDESSAIVPTSKPQKSSVIPESKDLIKQLKKTGQVSVSIPVQGELHPKGDETKGRIEATRQLGQFSTGITLHYGEGRNWDDPRFAKDMLQNFYDGNGNTLEGVDIEIKEENGKYKVKISGKGIYDYKQVFKLGKNEHTSKDAGKYGEGMKVMFATLLDSRGTTYVKHSSGDWVINLTAEQGAESSSKTRVFGDLQRAETRQEGATVEFDTTDEELVQEILKAKDYFYSPYNTDFQNLDFENEFFGIKLLPKGEKGNIYVVQRYEVDGLKDSGLDNTIDGMTLVFKVMPDHPEIATNRYNEYLDFKLETGRNRIPLTNYEIYQLVRNYAMTIPEKDLINIIGSMKDTYIYKSGKKQELQEKILDAFCLAAYLRDLKIDFGHDNYLAANRDASTEDMKFAIGLGKTLVVDAMEKVGVPNLGKYLAEAKKDVLPKSQLTEAQANKIKLIDEAVKLFTENLDIENMHIITPQEASNPRYIYNKPDRDKSSERAEAIVGDNESYGMWISSDFIDSKYNDLFEYMGTWLHEISHKVGGDGEKVFNDRLQRLILLVSQMCEVDPAFRTKLTVLNEEFKKLNGRKSYDMSEDLNSEAFKEQMEQSLKWLTEDPELPKEGEGYKPTVLDYLANQKDRFERKVEKKVDQYQMKFANWVVGLSQKLEKATANLPDDNVVGASKSETNVKQTPTGEKEQLVTSNPGEFEFNPVVKIRSSNRTSWTDKQYDTKELQEIQETGSKIIEMPPLTDKAPKIEFSGIRESDRARFEAAQTVESQMTLNYNSSNAWSLPQVVRDMLQNMYDGHNGTLDGVKFDIKIEDGKYKIKIIGQSEYDYFHIENIGASGEENLNDGTRGGGFGEGAKMVPLHLLYGKYVDKFTYASGDWKIDFSRQKDAQGNELPVDEGYMMMTPGVNKNRVSGNYVEFETTDPKLVQAILVARDYFNHSENPDFKDFDVETPDMGITILPSNENGNLYYNQRYSIKSDGKNNRAEFDEIVNGLRIVFKRTLSKDELARVRMSKDCDRLGLSKNDVHKITNKLAESMSDEQLMDAITRLQRYWVYKPAPSEYESKTFEQSFAHGLIDLAISRGLSFVDVSDSKIVCVDTRNYDRAKAEELIRRGYKIADNALSYLGFPKINDIFIEATRIEPYKASDLTLQEQQKILLLEEALGISKTDVTNGFQASIVIFDHSQYQDNIELYTREVEGFDVKLPYLAIDREFLSQNDFSTCYNALISELRRIKSDSEANFGYHLTDLIRYQLRELSLPQNAKKLKLIEERYKEIE